MSVIVISGGSSGIGEACVKKYLENNHIVFNLDIKDNSLLNKHTNYNYLPTDLRDEAQIAQSVKHILKQNQKIDVLVACGGMHLSANIEDTTNEQLHNLINLNILGVYWSIKYIIPGMKQNKNGSIIIIGSDQSTIAKPNSAVYGMTKAAVNHLAKSTALDYAKYNIRVNCLGVGSIDTPLYHNAIIQYSARSGINLADVEKDELAQQPIGRIGKPEEVAELVYFLGQDNVSYITGALIPIDGGYIAR